MFIKLVNRGVLLCLAAFTISLTGCAHNVSSQLIVTELTVQDTETGLVWARNIKEGNKAITEYKGVILPQYQGTNIVYSLSYEEAQALIRVLNKKNYAGYADWRLPAKHEFRRIHDMAEDNDGRMQYQYSTLGFVGACGYYWSSTPGKYWTPSELSNMVQIGTCPWYVLQGRDAAADVWPVRGAEVDLPYTKRATGKAQTHSTQPTKSTNKAIKPKPYYM